MVLLLSSWWIGVDRFGDLIRVEFLLWKGLLLGGCAWNVTYCLGDVPWIDSSWLSVMQQLWGVFFNYISNIDKFSVVEDHLAYIHSEVGLGVRLFFLFSLKMWASSCRHFQRKILQVWGDEVFTFLDGALGPSTFSGGVGKKRMLMERVGWELKHGGKLGRVGTCWKEYIERNSDRWLKYEGCCFLQTCDQQFDSLKWCECMKSLILRQKSSYASSTQPNLSPIPFLTLWIPKKAMLISYNHI